MASQPSRERTYPVLPTSQLRVDFNPALFSQAIRDHGVNWLWLKSTRCACLANSQTFEPMPNCPVCHGRGYEHWGAQVVRGIVESLDLNKETQTAFGQWAFGLSTITVESAFLPAIRDVMVNLTAVYRYTERRERTADAGTLERLRYEIATRMDLTLYDDEPKPASVNPWDGSHADSTGRPVGTYEQIAENQQAAEAIARTTFPRVDVPIAVQRLRVMDPMTRVPKPYALREGTDFEVRDGCIDWTLGDELGTAPAVGGVFAVDYLYHPRYVVTSFVHAARDQYLRACGYKQPCDGGPPRGERLYRFPVQMIAKLDALEDGSNA